ncbi:hypothetical protein SS50377_20620 [Spironucleus salmonicida]|uniref:Uncharacterized protein n=1 Tax=Spironucleus salmonicida TaxID=348837 RepID=V6LMG7_9EUKA|nr:hypothetical protein SS50377_20620 [Spironucleus salmonicida]|eukprot:EST45887.1 Hypothetical protein SS50377_14178 [Spironucleus salmonicida]
MIYEIYQLAVGSRQLLFQKTLHPITGSYKQLTPKLVTSFFSQFHAAQSPLGPLAHVQFADFSASFAQNEASQVVVLHSCQSRFFGVQLAGAILQALTKYQGTPQPELIQRHRMDILGSTVRGILLEVGEMRYVQNAYLVFGGELITSRSAPSATDQLAFLQSQLCDRASLVLSAAQRIIAHTHLRFTLAVHINKRKTETAECEYSLNTAQGRASSEDAQDGQQRWCDLDDMVADIFCAVSGFVECYDQVV